MVFHNDYIFDYGNKIYPFGDYGRHVFKMRTNLVVLWLGFLKIPKWYWSWKQNIS